MSIGILGAGAFGTALGVSLARDGHAVTLWARDPQTVQAINETRKTPRLPGIALPQGLTATSDLQAAARHQTLLLATPMQTLGQVLHAIACPLSGHALVACCKGLDLGTGDGATAVITRMKPQACAAVLTGPSFAADIARNLPTALTLACKDAVQGEALQHQLSSGAIRLYRTEDTTGAELGGALKNVIAIACGACIGAGLGDSARAALMTRGFAEMTRLAQHLGAETDTLRGLSGLGDLTLTCTSDLSRNFRYGRALGQGRAFDPKITVEGAATAQAAARLAQDARISLPVTRATAALTTGALTVAQAMDQLLSRPLKDE